MFNNINAICLESICRHATNCILLRTWRLKNHMIPFEKVSCEKYVENINCYVSIPKIAIEVLKERKNFVILLKSTRNFVISANTANCGSFRSGKGSPRLNQVVWLRFGHPRNQSFATPRERCKLDI